MQKSIKGYALAFTLQTLLLSELTAMDVDLNNDNKENLLLTTNTPKKEDGISDAILLKENIIPPGRDIIVAFGNTNNNKSTVLNLLSGHKIGLSKSYYKVETDDGTQKIFQPVDNKSSEPQFAINDDGLILIDIPFYSSYNKESLDKEMVDKALRIQSIITTAKSVRFLFIESKESIESTRGEDFKKLFKSIGNFIPSKQLENSSIFILTGSHTNNQNLLIKFLNNKLDNGSIEILKQIFHLSDDKPLIFSLLSTQQFIQEDEDSGEQFLDTDKATNVLKATKDKIETSIKNLHQTSIKQLNAMELFKADMDLDDDIAKKFKDFIAKDLEAFLRSVDLEDLEQAKEKLDAKLVADFKDRMRDHFIKQNNTLYQLDGKSVEYGIKQGFREVDYVIEELKYDLERKIAERERDRLINQSSIHKEIGEFIKDFKNNCVDSKNKTQESKQFSEFFKLYPEETTDLLRSFFQEQKLLEKRHKTRTKKCNKVNNSWGAKFCYGLTFWRNFDFDSNNDSDN